VAEIRSRPARRLISDWALERGRFWQGVPKEMAARLEQPLSDREAEEARA
jgi:glutamate synthase (NADPH/NADH) large chain